MKRTLSIIPTIIIFILVAGIASLPFILKSDKNDDNLIVGTDKDKYSCISSAGYFWDEESKKCIRPWEIKNKTYCKSPRPELCTMDYAPVCGAYSKEIQCIKAPCAETYSNGCLACSDEKVEFYIEGECQ